MVYKALAIVRGGQGRKITVTNGPGTACTFCYLESFEEVQVGDRVDIAKTITEADAVLYSAATGDFGPVHLDDGYARSTRSGGRIAPGIMVAGIATCVLSSRLVGVLGVSIEDRFWFTGPVRYGDTITVEVWRLARRCPRP